VDRGSLYQKETCTRIGLEANIALTLGKLWAGIFGHSQAMIADALHSLSDVVSTSVVFLGLRIAKRPPDEDHPYGHGEADTLAALFVSIILLLTGGYMAISTLQMFIHRRFQAPSQIALWAAMGSILLKWVLYRYTLRAGKISHSSALVANAYDHKSDSYSSVAALVGILGARMGWRYLDPLAGLFIAILILKLSLRLLRSNLHLLMEGVPDPSITDEIENIGFAHLLDFTFKLKEFENKILGAEDKIHLLEQQLFENIVRFTSTFVQPIQMDATLIARLDCLLSFAAISLENDYHKPELNNEYALDIRAGRHPVIEQNMPPDEHYIPNDIYLDNNKQQIIILTGPNMSGKSALLRQTALIVLMAQMGCYVPADSAQLGLVDKIFTRVGASDNISSGESTFMVEMNETASILNNISNRSLILLDEIGRGTSTYDGISIAWSIGEFLHNHPAYRAKVLFATHYHELNEMAASMPRIKNYHIAIKEMGNKVIFLRKLKKGGSEHSFGIHVAEMAGMPVKILKRAKELLEVLEKSHSHNKLEHHMEKPNPADDLQLSFIQLDDPLLFQIKQDILNTDIDTLTPVEALMKLNQIKNLLKGID